MKKSRISLALMATMLLSLPIFTACKSSEPTPDPNGRDLAYFVLPLEEFGASKDRIFTLEKSRGAVIDEANSSENTLIVSSTFEDEKSTITYYFENDKYSHAYGVWESTKSMDEFISTLTSQKIGFELNEEYTIEGEKVFTRKREAFTSVISLTTKADKERMAGSFTFGPLNEELFSAVRLSSLPSHDLILPLVTEELSQTFVWRYEARQGHVHEPELSSDEIGRVVFLLDNPHIKTVKYWFDKATRSHLEESGIYFKPENLPSEEAIDEILTKYGFEKTTLTVENTSTVIYFHREKKCVAQYELQANNQNADFEPYLQFYYYDLTDKLPKLEVDFPMPLIKFQTMSLEKSIEWYKQQPYYVSTEDYELGGIIKTNSEDFDMIIIGSEDGTKTTDYLYCLVCTDDYRAVSSPQIVKMLLDMGFKEKVGPILPTYENEELQILAQINTAAIGGIYTVSFEPMGL